MTDPLAAARQVRADYANARRVLTGKARSLRIPVAVLGQILSELDDGALRYAEEALGSQLVKACIDIALRDGTEEVPCLKSA